MFVGDGGNNRVLIYNTIPTSDNVSANVVIGQANMSSGNANQGGLPGANTISFPGEIYSDGTKLFIADAYNSRVLIFNTIPTSNNASANTVIGQMDMSGFFPNQGGAVDANTLQLPMGVSSDGTKLFVSDFLNHRVLIFNSIPTSNNASANVVVGQTNMTSNSANQGGSVGANTLSGPGVARVAGSNLFIADVHNNRVLVYRFKPTLAEITSVGITADNTPSYTFSSDETGTISYGGDCSSGTTSASTGNNTVTLGNLSDGTYSNCKITVTNGAGIASSQLDISSFTVDTTDPVISNVIEGAVYAADVTPTFNEGTAILNGASFASGTAISSEGDYTLIVTDEAGNASTVRFSIDKSVASPSGIVNGETYFCSATPTFYEGTATLNGIPFSSGQTITEDGDYVLVITDSVGNVRTTQFKIEKISSQTPTIKYSRFKNAKEKTTFSVCGLDFPRRAKSKYFSVKLNAKRVRVVRVRDRDGYLAVTIKLEYGKWPKGSYDLAMTYKKLSNDRWQKESLRKNDFITIN